MHRTTITPILNLFYRLSSLSNGLIHRRFSYRKKQEEVKRAKPRISEYPTFYKAPIVQAVDNLEQAWEAIKIMSERAYQEMLASPREKELLAKASRYDIPCDKENIDWLRLIAQIEEQERLFIPAMEGHLKVNPIEEEVLQSRKEMRDLRADYCRTVL